MLTAFITLGVLACASEPGPEAADIGIDPASGVSIAVPTDDAPQEADIHALTEGNNRLSGLAEGDPDDVNPEPDLPLADSVAEFSSVQGKDNWFYGYYEPDTDSAFHEAGTFVSGGADPGWYAGAGGVTWTFLDAETMHPNGEVTTGGREPVEQWAVRRWVSEVEGDIRITGHLAKYWVDGASGGVAGYVFVDGEMVWAWYIEGWDDGGTDIDKVVTVAHGSTVDFALDPWESDDRSDRSLFTATIWGE
jgi:hypothetical protein